MFYSGGSFEETAAPAGLPGTNQGTELAGLRWACWDCLADPDCQFEPRQEFRKDVGGRHLLAVTQGGHLLAKGSQPLRTCVTAAVKCLCSFLKSDAEWAPYRCSQLCTS